MYRNRFAVLVLSLGFIGVFALPALAQDATAQVTPPATEVSTPATSVPTEMSTAEATAVSTEMSTVAPPPATSEPTAEATAAATAPAATATTIVSGLNNPRGLSFDSDGNLFIAEAGAAGTTIVGTTDQGNLTAGLTSQITEWSQDGKQSVLPGFFPSGGDAQGEIVGIERVYSRGNSYWLVLSDQGNGNPFSDSVVEIDKASGRVKTYIPLYFVEAAYNPDGNEINSNVNDIAWSADGIMYIADAGANTVYYWTRTGGLRIFHTWKDDSVPTSIRVGRSGDIYIGFLGAGIAPKAGKIEHWTRTGRLVQTISNLTAVTDIAIGKDGNLYATELAQFGAQGPQPNSGDVIEIVKGTPTIVASGLNAPFGLAQASDGSWLVTVNSTFAAPGSGAVVKIG